MKVYRQWVPYKRSSLYNFMPVFMQLCTSFFSMVWTCACGLDLIIQLIFVTFPLCLSFFAGATSTSLKFDLYLFYGEWMLNLNICFNLLDGFGIGKLGMGFGNTVFNLLVIWTHIDTLKYVFYGVNVDLEHWQILLLHHQTQTYKHHLFHFAKGSIINSSEFP